MLLTNASAQTIGVAWVLEIWCRRHRSIGIIPISEAWAHMEPDNLTIQGFCCWYCNNILRTRYKGWKQDKLRDAMRDDEEEKKRFDGLRGKAIEFYKSGGQRAPLAIFDGPAQSQS